MYIKTMPIMAPMNLNALNLVHNLNLSNLVTSSTCDFSLLFPWTMS